MIQLQLDSLVMMDSLSVVSEVANTPICDCRYTTLNSSNLIDTIIAIAMAVIALVNIILTIYIFCQSRKDSSEGEKKRRKFELIQTLILNNRLHLLYEFYDAVSNECRKLLDSNDQKTKMAINEANITLLKKFRHDFVMPFNVVDHELFVSLKQTADDLVDGMTEAIFDEGINLRHEPKFTEKISEPLSLNRNTMLSKLYEMACIEIDKD